jgi:hypothetical protein
MCDISYKVAHYYVFVSHWGHHVLPGTWLAQGDEIYVEFYIKGTVGWGGGGGEAPVHPSRLGRW